MKKTFKVAICQTKIVADKLKNLDHVQTAIEEATSQGAEFCFLPECLNSLYRKDRLQEAAENFSSSIRKTPTLNLLKSLAKKYQVYITGSLPERDDSDKLYNTAVVFNREGEMIAKYRKLHLFDIDIPGQITYKESETFQAGRAITVFDTEYCKMGISVCYDIRFPELSLLMSKLGAKMLIYPGAFNLTTGPIHWELLLRARAVDHQCYVAGVSSARFTENATEYYQAWGHSTLIDPMGTVLCKAKHDEKIMVHEVDLDFLDNIRKQLPYNSQKRHDVYDVLLKE